MMYNLIQYNDDMVKRFQISMSRLLKITVKFIAFKMRIKVILSADGLTIDVSERKPLRHRRATGIGTVQ